MNKRRASANCSPAHRADKFMDRQATNAQEAQTPHANSATAPLDVLTGDVPFIRAETLVALVQQHRTHRGHGAGCTLMSVRLDDPTGYGRVVRDAEGRFERIVEQRDATPEERQLNEINAGIYCF